MDQLSPEGLQALSDADPASLDLALLDPLKQQLAQADPNDPNTAMMQAAVDKLMQAQVGRLDALCREMTEEWQRAVKQRKPVEDRWIDDERQFNGKPITRDSKAYSSDAADPNRGNSEPIVSNATRRKTLMCWGRLCDMLLPANDFPMRVDAPEKPDPNEYPQSLAQAMQQAQAKVQAAMQQDPQGGAESAPKPEDVLAEVASQQASDMQDAVFEMLTDAKFQSSARKALYDTSRIGCGIIKGPFPSLKQCRKFQQGGNFDIQETPTAGIAYVNPWFFWYDMATDLGRASKTFEIQLCSRRELADFKRYPRTITTTIDDLLKEKDPKLDGDFRTAMDRRNTLTDLKEPLDDVYAVLETHAVITPEKLGDLTGIEWQNPEMPVLHIWSVNGRCIKFKLTPLERDFRLDYYNFTIMPADDTIYGYGYPYLARSGQRFMDGAVNATLANAAASVAPIILVSQGKVQPNREQWRMRGLNVFSVENQSAPLEQFFASVMVQSNVEQNLKLLEVAEDMIDRDTLFEQILEGGENQEEMPASGMVMRANLANVFQKSIAAYADDNVFQPLCERLIWWRKMYGDALGKAPIEGDMMAKAIASTQLVSKDLALQHTQAAIQMSANPLFAGFFDAYTLASAFVHNIDGLPNKEQVLHNRDDALANQAQIQKMQQGGDPGLAAKLANDMQIAQLKIQSEERLAMADQQTRLLEMQGRVEVADKTVQAQLIIAAGKTQVDMQALATESAAAASTDATRRYEVTLDKAIQSRIEFAKLNAPVGERPYSSKD